ncbi:site-specific integrase [Sanguibacter sp. Z1732]|uniref:site-specific integrase n=1 Tax=Sanguibacter sp. Z1732 TaxID=3435412 RepID=UPI003D9C913C
MVTGLRVNEATSLRWYDLQIIDDQLYVTVRPQVSKTHRGRRVPLLDARVADRILQRRHDDSADEDFVIGSPAVPTKQWDSAQRVKATATLYIELAEALGIELLQTARSHVWRATLNSMLLGQVPEVQRAGFFGHTEEVNRGHYTDVSDTSAMVEAVQSLNADLSSNLGSKSATSGNLESPAEP